MSRTFRWVLPALLLATTCSTTMLHAQWQANTGPAGAAMGAVVGGDVERYVRALIIAGRTAPVAWGTRPLGPADLAQLLRDSSGGDHPWKIGMQRALTRRASAGAMGFASVNSGFAWGANDGPMWQGRGLNGALGVSAVLRWGPLTAVAAPVAFIAQNSSFPLRTPPVLTVSPYADALFPTIVDLPQRMGGSSYARLDAGESSIRLRARQVEIGISTASLGWGTGESFAAIFGANAGGFPHLFAGTSGRGLRLPYVGRFSGRYVLGLLQQSDFSSVVGSETYIDVNQPGTKRIAVGVNVSYMPALLPNFELGASRFYHSPYREPSRRWSAWSKPFEGIFKASFSDRSGGPGDEGGDNDNQIASLYARFVFPGRGVEANFEMLREDHNWDARDLAQEPENNGAILASIRATTHRSEGNLSLLTMEYFDGDIRPIAQVRPQGFIYSHGYLRQGHTQRGQLLGSPIGAGAIAGQRVAWERFTPNGSLRANLQRWRTRSTFTTDPETLTRPATSRQENNHDWIIDGSLAKTTYRGGRTLMLEGGLAWAGVFNFDSARPNFYTRASIGLF